MPSQLGLLSSDPSAHERTRDGGFLAAVPEQLESYVYLLIDPRDDRVFSVGEGTGDVCFAHLRRARATTAEIVGDLGGLDVIRDIERAGRRVRIDILRHGLDAATAAAVAAALRDAMRLHVPGASDTHPAPAGIGRLSIGQVNDRYGARPVTIAQDHAVMLVRVGRAYRRGTDDGQLYELARGWWPAQARDRDPRLAFAVHEGIVRAVYRIDGWEPARAGNRWGFRGGRDADMEAEYLDRDVSAYLDAGRRAEPSFVNC